MSNRNDPPKKCTYKCIFDPLILQDCYVLKNLDEKELDYFFEYKDKNSIYRTKKLIVIVVQKVVMVSITLNSG